MEYFNNLALILCSVGLMVVGANFIATNVKMAFENFIVVVGRGCHTNGYLRAVWGITLGALTQSFSVIAFIGANLVMNENLLLRNALLLSAWGGVGTSLSYLNMALSRKALAYLLIGISGMSFFKKLNEKWTHIRLCVFGYGLLFLGLTLMIPAAQSIKNAPIIFEFFSQPASPLIYLLMWVCGAVFGFVPYILMMLVVGFSAAGVLELSKAMLLIYGMAIGQALFAWTLSNQPSPVISATRKIGMFRIIYGSVGSIFFLILFYIEEYWGVPLVKSLLLSISNEQIYQVIILGVITTFCSTILMLPFVNRIEKRMLAWEPISVFEDESKPKFINKEVLAIPDLALEMLLKDEVRLIEFFQKYLEYCRDHIDGDVIEKLNAINKIHSNVKSVLQQLHVYESRLQQDSLSQRSSLVLLSLVERNSIIVSLDSSIFQFAEHAIRSTTSETREIISSFTESLDVILMVACELYTDPLEHAELLRRVTFDRKTQLNEIRDKYLMDKFELTMQVKSSVIILCGITERIFWLYQSLAENILSIIETVSELENSRAKSDL